MGEFLGVMYSFLKRYMSKEYKLLSNKISITLQYIYSFADTRMQIHDKNQKDIKDIGLKNTIRFLSECLLNSNNVSHLTEYFVEEYSQSPEHFFYFMHEFKETLISQESHKKLQLCKSYFAILSFMCERFWAYQLKLELDDLCFSILDPKAHNELSKKLEKYKKNSQIIIKKIFKKFQDKLDENNIEARVMWRYKNIYSIYKKCLKRWDIDVFKLSDIFAFRIITPENDRTKCFDVLQVLHDSFIPIPKRFKDYITIPKINGYQSIHTWLLEVIDDLDLVIEVQIRSESMHDISERWVAAHYLYARDKKASLSDRKEEKLYEHIVKEGNEKNSQAIYCVNTRWNIVKLKTNASVADFATKIHSKLRDKIQKVFVNEKEEWAYYKIQQWDTIEIISSQKAYDFQPHHL